MAQTLLVASYLGTTYSLHQFNYLSAVFFFASNRSIFMTLLSYRYRENIEIRDEVTRIKPTIKISDAGLTLILISNIALQF